MFRTRKCILLKLLMSPVPWKVCLSRGTLSSLTISVFGLLGLSPLSLIHVDVHGDVTAV